MWMLYKPQDWGWDFIALGNLAFLLPAMAHSAAVAPAALCVGLFFISFGILGYPAVANLMAGFRGRR